MAVVEPGERSIETLSIRDNVERLLAVVGEVLEQRRGILSTERIVPLRATALQRAIADSTRPTGRRLLVCLGYLSIVATSDD
jgi:hypothetical protein